MPATTCLETGKSGLFSALETAEERLIRPIEPCQHILQHMTIDGGIVGHHCPEIFQLSFLLIAGNRDAALLPEDDALFERSVLESAALPYHLIQHSLLLGGSPEPVLVGFAETPVAHDEYFPECFS